MKKPVIIMLALVFVLGIAGTAFAANPFVDVPANHWAYGAVAKLAKAGIVDGMGDGTYQGARNMTRYEMAQIVAKAMAKADKADAANKALLEKLEAEFAAELTNLGVRVSKLEAKVGSVAFSGDARVRWIDAGWDDTTTDLRLRLNMTAQVNENTSFYGRFMAMNSNEFGSTSDDKCQVIDANFTVKNILNSDVTATVGRFSQAFLQTGYFADTDGLVDGAKVMFGNKVKMTIGYADFSPAAGIEQSYEVRFAEAGYDLSKATNIKAFYFNDTTSHETFNVVGAGLQSKLNKDWTLLVDYNKNRINFESTGYNPVMWVGRIAYKGHDKDIVGSWGANLEYRKAEYGSVFSNFSGASIPMMYYDEDDNFLGIKGWNIYYGRTLAKNVTFEAYYMFNNKYFFDGLKVDAPDFTRIQINYFF